MAIKGYGMEFPQYIGLVLDKYENNYYEDSDFKAIVYIPEKDRVEHIEYATTRGYTYDNWAEIDASPEVIEKAKTVILRNTASFAHAQYVNESAVPKIGKLVEVVKGRKHKGKKGIVTWLGENSFSGYPRVRVENSEESFFVDSTYCIVVNPGDYIPSMDEIEKACYFFNWRSLTWDSSKISFKNEKIEYKYSCQSVHTNGTIDLTTEREDKTMTHTTESLNKLTRAAVYKIAKEVAKVNSLSGYHNLKKAEFIELILKYDSDTTISTPVVQPVDAGALLEAAQKHNAAKAKKVKKDEVLTFADALKLVQAQGYDTITVNVEQFKVYLVSGSHQTAFLLPRDAVAYAQANPVVKPQEPELNGQSCDVLEGWVGKSCDVLEGWAGKFCDVLDGWFVQSCEIPTPKTPRAQNELHKVNLDKAMKSHKRYGLSLGEIDYLSFSVDVYYGTVKLGRIGCNVMGQHWFSFAYAPKASVKVASFDAAVTHLVRRLPKPAKKAA